MPLTNNEDRMRAAESALGGPEDLDTPDNSLGLGGTLGGALGKLESKGVPGQLSGAGQDFAKGLRESAQRAKQELAYSGPEVIDQSMPLQDMLAFLEG